MTCLDARERLPDLLDGLLAGPERRELEFHLETCAECARERNGLRKTVALLQRVELARAPAGFIDRVMARTVPEPWLRRALRAAFVPVGMKLPAQAAAIALLTIGTVYVFQWTPELRQAAQTEAPGGWRDPPGAPSTAAPPASRSTATGSTATESMEIGRGLRTDKVPSVPPASLELSEDRLVAGQPPGAPPEPAKRVPVPRPAGSDEPFTAAASAPPQPGPPPGRADEPTGRPTAGTPPAPTREAPAGAQPAMTARSRESMVGDQRGTSESAARLALEPARGPEPVPSPPPVPPRQETGATGSGTRDLPAYARQPTEARESRSTSSPPARADETLGRLAARMLAPDVTIRLVASDRAALSVSLADLVARAGGAEAGRRPDGSDLVIEVVVPRAAYAEFAREVVRLGQTADVRGAPELPPAVRVLIRIAP